MTCPQCGTEYLRAIRCAGMIRDYRCPFCGHEFKTVERLYPTEVVHTIHSNTPRMLEHQLHNKYAGIRAFGEWFHLTEKDIQWLKML